MPWDQCPTGNSTTCQNVEWLLIRAAVQYKALGPQHIQDAGHDDDNHDSLTSGRIASRAQIPAPNTGFGTNASASAAHGNWPQRQPPSWLHL
ncbi:hypothetical protein TOPH_04805 [Tolypocladium ophioglossoides CBS 100239]|uniref:Uncharacterized protein n=1 Tax=Tolypocladium ophioglossoides (strain CBS 100239) TaxID=1163406 RepID=A0A0L0N937_TOLOC|nr:hypothetical protein TOPH_04805 [Tolypocladium ophioglossoides CBS 100239]